MGGDNNNNKNASLAKQFLEIAKPNEDGFSAPIAIEDLIKANEDFRLGNGGSWCREDGPLKEYNIRRIKKGGKIVAVQLDGKNKRVKNRAIKNSIKKKITQLPCAVLLTHSNIECDHKDGMYDDSKVADISTQSESDFQPLSKAANGAKRTHCNRCKDTALRFDAKQLGYSESFLQGDQHSKTCVGCYWYDPKKFNAEISKDFQKKFH